MRVTNLTARPAASPPAAEPQTAVTGGTPAAATNLPSDTAEIGPTPPPAKTPATPSPATAADAEPASPPARTAAPVEDPLVAAARTAGSDVAVAANGSTLLMTEPAAVAPSRNEALGEAFGRAQRAYCEDGAHWRGDAGKRAYAFLTTEYGITPDMHTDAHYDRSLRGEAGQQQLLEWYLGQVLSLASQEKHTDPLDGFLYHAQAYCDRFAGQNITSVLDERDERNERALRSLDRQCAERGFLVNVRAFQAFGDAKPRCMSTEKLYGSGWLSAPELTGKRVVVVQKSQPFKEYEQFEGVFQPHEQGGALYRLEKDDGTTIELNSNDQAALFVRDTSPTSLSRVEKQADQRGDVKFRSKAYDALFGSGWFDATKVAGRRATVVEANRSTHQFDVHQGTIEVVASPSSARYGLRAADGSVRSMSINDAHALFVEDTSPVKPGDAASVARDKGFKQVEPYTVGADDLKGRRGMVVYPDPEKGQFKVYEGRFAPQGHQRFRMQTDDGATVAFDPYHAFTLYLDQTG